MLSRQLNDLDPAFRLKACELIAYITEAGIAVMIVNTRRSPEDQARLLAEGKSWTKNSLHLVGKAIDLAPFELYQAFGPDKLSWTTSGHWGDIWTQMGLIGESLGLKWGGRWERKDWGHFQTGA